MNLIPTCDCDEEIQDEGNHWTCFVNHQGDIEIIYGCPECGAEYEGVMEWDKMEKIDRLFE